MRRETHVLQAAQVCSLSVRYQMAAPPSSRSGSHCGHTWGSLRVAHCHACARALSLLCGVVGGWACSWCFQLLALGIRMSEANARKMRVLQALGVLRLVNNEVHWLADPA